MRDDWRTKGLCANLSDQEVDKVFNIGPGQSANRARLFCASCPVKKECLNYALTYDELGIWAGTTDAERNLIPVFIKEELRLRGAASVEGLESRNMNDFIPLPRSLRSVTPEPELEPPVELLGALSLQYESSIDLPAFG